MLKRVLFSLLVLGVVAGCEVSQVAADGARIAGTVLFTEGFTSLFNAIIGGLVTVTPV